MRVLHDWGGSSPDCDGMGPLQSTFGQRQQLLTIPQGQFIVRLYVDAA